MSQQIWKQLFMSKRQHTHIHTTLISRGAPSGGVQFFLDTRLRISEAAVNRPIRVLVRDLDLGTIRAGALVVAFVLPPDSGERHTSGRGRRRFFIKTEWHAG